jgi:hypothetical protein
VKNIQIALPAVHIVYTIDKENNVTPRMSCFETTMLQNFLRCSRNYLEYGSGGSTFEASRLVTSSITSVDSSKHWLDKVDEACSDDCSKIKPNLIYANIGPVGDWGRPVDAANRDLWPSYYGDVWGDPRVCDTDLYLIDGRFRVACFAKIVLNCRNESIILVHDFASRTEYHVVKEISREIARTEDLSAFIPVKLAGFRRAQEILAQYRYDPN